MGRYIDADALLEQLNRKRPDVGKARYTEGFNDAILRVRSMISASATNDVVEVVRCKDCEYYITPDRGYPYCAIMSNEGEGEYYTPSGDHYCSHGERK